MNLKSFKKCYNPVKMEVITMEKTEITKICDACKKKANELYPIKIPKEIMPEENREFTPELYKDQDLDICSKCMKEVVKILKIK